MIFKKLFNLAEIAKYQPTELLAYRDSLKDYRDYYNTIEYAEIKGETRGRMKGRAEGEKSKAVSIARGLKNKGVMSIEEIAEMTGLTIEEINNL
jgi:predicted transposase/invertase (TIGR01784 family)